MQQFFYVRREKKYEQIIFDEIIYVKAKKGYIQIVTEQKTYLVMNTLTVVKKYLPDDLFCRIHHSYIVALARVKAFDRTFVQLRPSINANKVRPGLAEVKELPVGFKYRAGLRKSVSVMMNKNGGNYRGIKKMWAMLEFDEMENAESFN